MCIDFRLAIKFIVVFLMSILLQSCKLFTVEDPANLVPAFELTDLSQYGLSSATDINDQGHIIGGNLYWDNGTTTNIPIIGRAINNHSQVVGNDEGAYLWEKGRGKTEIRPTYLDHLEIVSQITIPYDINNKGQVVLESLITDIVREEDGGDFYIDTDNGLLWDSVNDSYTLITSFGIPRGINDHGQVVGYHPIGAFIWENITGQGINFLDPNADSRFSEAHAINNVGQVVGFVEVIAESDTLTSKGKQNLEKRTKEKNKLLQLTGTRGIYDYGHVVEILKKITIDSDLFALKNIDKNGFIMEEMHNEDLLSLWTQDEQQQIIENALSRDYKSEAFIWDKNNGIQRLGTLGGEWSTAFDINDHGQVVGYSDIGNGEHRAFYWDEDHGMVKIPALGGNSIARAINNKGEVVGESYDSSGQNYPVMWKVTFKDQEFVASW